MKESPQSLEEALFELAVQKPTAAERGAFLDGVCRDKPALRARLDVLLEGHFGGAGFLKAAEREVKTVPAPQAVESRAQVIGRYKLLEKIGEGGFGEVWMAEQREPVKRRVALKIIKLGMDSKQVVARFEAERQALALMDHPNIAKVFDAGTTDTGRPYFVMELVRGIKVTEYCDQNQLPTQERLKLFIMVCQAIQHAHQKGIIHRDIKPSNILVTLHDSVPVPKVIDFGIAKATQGELTDKTVFTQFQQFIGTPAYISPEQAEMSGLDVDTRADIYSLGVLLYELLVGQTPFDAKEMMKGGLDSMRQIIREKEPVKPSTKLKTLPAVEATTTAQRRQTDPSRLTHQLRGDLDWIVMKCLEKDRTRRYETANGLARDIDRYLANEPILARPPSAAYKIQKAWQRNKLVFSAGAMVALALVVGLGVSIWQTMQANKARQREATARQDEAKARTRSELNEQVALSNAAVALTQRQQAEIAVQRMQIQTAENYFTAGESARAVSLLAQVLDANPSNYVAAQRLSSALLHRPFLVPTHIMTGSGHFPFSGVLLEFSSDGKLIASGSMEGVARVWDSRTGEPIGEPMRHAKAVCVTRFSPDGKWVMTGSEDSTARIWNARTGQPVSEPLPHKLKVSFGEFSPDGKTLVTGSFDGSLHFWDTQNGRELGKPVQVGAVRCFRFSPDGSRLAVGCTDDSARLMDVSTRTEIAKLAHRLDVVSVNFSPDGRLFATASYDGAARIWSAETGQPASPPLMHMFTVNWVEFSPDGQMIVTAANDSTARLWSVATGRQIGSSLQHHGRVMKARFSPDGRRLLTISEDETARLWNVSTGQPVSEPMAHGSRVYAAAFAPDGATVATGSEDGTIRIWPVREAGGPLLHLGQSYARRVCFSPDGRLAASADASNIVQLWNAQSGAPIGSPLPYAPIKKGYVESLRFSPDGKRLVSAAGDGTARVWYVGSGQSVGKPMQHELMLFSAVFSPDSQRVATASYDGTARVWDASTGEPIGRPCRHQGWIMTVEFSSDGKRLVTASEDHTARVWDAVTGQPIGNPFIHSNRVYIARFNKDGSRIMTGSEDRTARVWDVASGQPIGEPLKHSAAIRSVAFSPDERSLLTGGEDGRARLWDAATGQPLIPPLAHGGWTSVQFSPDGRMILTWADTTSVRLWDAHTGQPLNEPMPGGRSAQFSPDGRWVITAGNSGARIFEIPQSTLPVPAWFPRFAEAVAGLHFVPGRQMEEPVQPQIWNQLAIDLPKSMDPSFEWVHRLMPSGNPALVVVKDVVDP